MQIKVYFQANGTEELIETAKSLSEANKIMYDKITSMNFISYYTRITFESDKRVWIDYGSHTKFFIFELENSKNNFMKLFHDYNKISILNELLKNTIDKKYFSIYSYNEQSVCLEEDKENYVTYIGEKGQRHNTKIHTNIDSAVKEIIHQLSESNEEEQNLITKYKEKTKFM